MSRIKRSSYFLVVFEDGQVLDVAAFLRGRIESSYQSRAIREGAVGLAGIGVQLSDGIDYSLDFAPYTPGETEI